MFVSDKAISDATPCSAKHSQANFFGDIINLAKAGLYLSDGMLVSDAPCKNGKLVSAGMLSLTNAE